MNGFRINSCKVAISYPTLMPTGRVGTPDDKITGEGENKHTSV
jgi:hypothetical protein